MRCSIKNIKLPSAPAATKPQRVADPREDAEVLRAVRKEQMIRKAREEIENSDNKKRPRVQTALTKAQRKKVVEMWKAGKQGKEIAEAIGMDVSKTFAAIYQLQTRGLIEKRNKYNKVDQEDILKELKTGKTVTQTAKDLNITRRTVQRWKRIFEKEGRI